MWWWLQILPSLAVRSCLIAARRSRYTSQLVCGAVHSMFVCTFLVWGHAHDVGDHARLSDLFVYTHFRSVLWFRVSTSLCKACAVVLNPCMSHQHLAFLMLLFLSRQFMDLFHFSSKLFLLVTVITSSSVALWILMSLLRNPTTTRVLAVVSTLVASSSSFVTRGVGWPGDPWSI